MSSNRNLSFKSLNNTLYIGISSECQQTFLSHLEGVEGRIGDRFRRVNESNGESTSISHTIFHLLSHKRKPTKDFNKKKEKGIFVMIPGNSEFLGNSRKVETLFIPDISETSRNSSSGNDYFLSLECLDLNISDEKMEIPLEKRLEILRGRNTFSEIFRFSLLRHQFLSVNDEDEKNQLSNQFSPKLHYIENSPVVFGDLINKPELLIPRGSNNSEHYHYLRKIYDPRNLLRQDNDLFLAYFGNDNEIYLQPTSDVWSQFVFDSLMKPLLHRTLMSSNDLVTTKKNLVMKGKGGQYKQNMLESPSCLDGFRSSNVVITVPDGLSSKEINEVYYQFQNFGGGRGNTGSIPNFSPILDKEQFRDLEGSKENHISEMRKNSVSEFFVNVVPESQVIASIIQSRPMWCETNVEYAKNARKMRREFGKKSSNLGSEYHMVMFIRDSYSSCTIYRKEKSVLLVSTKNESRKKFEDEEDDVIFSSTSDNNNTEDDKIEEFLSQTYTREMNTIRSVRHDHLGNKSLDQDILLSIFRDGVGMDPGYEKQWNYPDMQNFTRISATLNWGKEELYFNLHQVREMRKFFYKSHEMLEDDEDSSEEQEGEDDDDEKKKKKQQQQQQQLPSYEMKLIQCYDEKKEPMYIDVRIGYLEFGKIVESHRRKIMDLIRKEIFYVNNSLPSLGKKKTKSHRRKAQRKEFLFLHIVSDLEYLDRELIVNLVDRFENDLYGWEDDTRYASIFDASLLSRRAACLFGSHKSGLINFQDSLLSEPLSSSSMNIEKQQQQKVDMIDEEEEEENDEALEDEDQEKEEKFTDQKSRNEDDDSDISVEQEFPSSLSFAQLNEHNNIHSTTTSSSAVVDVPMRKYFEGISKWIGSPIWMIDRKNFRFGCRTQALSSLNPRFVEVDLHPMFQFSTKETIIQVMLDESDEVCPIEIWQASLTHPNQEYHFRNNVWIWVPIHILLLSPLWMDQNLESSSSSKMKHYHHYLQQQQQQQKQQQDGKKKNEEKVAPMVDDCVRQKMCTFEVTGDDFAVQRFFECDQCDNSDVEEEDRKYFCESCKESCHFGHEGVKEHHQSPYYYFCDCGAGNPECKGRKNKKKEKIEDEEEEEITQQQNNNNSYSSVSNSPNGIMMMEGREKRVEIGISYWSNQVLRIRVSTIPTTTAATNRKRRSRVYFLKPVFPEQEFKDLFSTNDPRSNQVNYLKFKNDVFFVGSIPNINNDDDNNNNNTINHRKIGEEYFIRPMNVQMDEMFGLRRHCDSWNLTCLKNRMMINKDMINSNQVLVEPSPPQQQQQGNINPLENLEKRMIDEDGIENDNNSSSVTSSSVTSNSGTPIPSLDGILSIINNRDIQKQQNQSIEDEESYLSEESSSSSEEEEEEVEEERMNELEDRFFFTTSMYARKRKFVDTRTQSKIFNIGDYRKRRRKLVTKINETVDNVLTDLNKIHPPVRECSAMKSTAKERNQFYDNVMDFY